MSKVLKKLEKYITEMPVNLRQARSGMMRTSGSISKSKELQYGMDTFRVKDKEYKAVKAVKVSELTPGMLVLGAYNKYNQGIDLYEFLGFTDDTTKYGDQFEKHGKIAFKTAKEMLKHYKVKTFKELEELQRKNEYGYGSYMCMRDVESNETGAWFYLFKGRWTRGSGAEPLSFTQVKEVPYTKMIPLEADKQKRMRF